MRTLVLSTLTSAFILVNSVPAVAQSSGLMLPAQQPRTPKPQSGAPLQIIADQGPAGQFKVAQLPASDLSPTFAEPIALRNLTFVRRDLEDLATRHGLPAPDAALTRQQLGTFFWQLITTLGKLPPDQMTSRDYLAIGRLTNDFEDVVQEVKGKMTMTIVRNEIPEAVPGTVSKEKGREFDERLSILEKVKISGDVTLAPQSDFGHKINQSTAANMRARINFQAKVHEAKAEDPMGDATVFIRLTAASGRFFPRNKYLMSPTNDLNDVYANPFNSGVNDVQITNLQINNNNSNNVRPTPALEQAWFSQDLRLAGGFKGKYVLGLNNFANAFDTNNFANNETLQFLSTQFVNNISWRPNFIGPSALISLERSLFKDRAFVRATSGMISLADRDYFGGFGTNHELQFGHRFFQKEGNIRAGFWQFNFRGGTPKPFITPTDTSPTGLLAILPGGAPVKSNPVGMYANFDQKIWKDIGIWGRYGINDKQLGEVFLGGLLSSRFAWSVGTEIPMKIFTKRRTDDVIGIAYGNIGSYRRGTMTPATPAFVSRNGVLATTLAEVNANLRAIDPGTRPEPEKTLEAYYRFQLNKNVSVSPDIQYIWSPGATAPQSGIFVLGTRLNVTF